MFHEIIFYKKAKLIFFSSFLIIRQQNTIFQNFAFNY